MSHCLAAASVGARLRRIGQASSLLVMEAQRVWVCTEALPTQTQAGTEERWVLVRARVEARPAQASAHVEGRQAWEQARKEA
ncbi:hypothetical protein GUJ93_ZPchr0008g12446 [Zizania palustris]|uniref:Uncharacterized protein n=1 Tax=Zizania palustris TaxID=103762 RepID=A0A8J5VHJ3_ZIZPA|nr:hypothetical protein GUJ93_ZPchr0008g12446 [Zizania palustris]